MTLKVKNGEIVVPGQLIGKAENYKLRQNIYEAGNNYYSMVLGVFRQTKGMLSISSFKRAYYPKVGDVVIGRIQNVHLTSWDVEIRGPYIGNLNFSNAGFREFDTIENDLNRILKINETLKLEIIEFNRVRDPKLSMERPGLGKLGAGKIVEVNPDNLRKNGGSFKSEISLTKAATKTKIFVGDNGRVWIQGETRESEELATKAVQEIFSPFKKADLKSKLKKIFV